jgi:hypothetical protein
MMKNDDAAVALLAQVRDLFRDIDGGDPAPVQRLLGVVQGAFPAMAKRPPSAADSETCRQAMLAAVYAKDHREADVWRARCLSRAAAVGWVPAIGSLVMGEAFRCLARDNDDYPKGKTFDVMLPSSAAEKIADEIDVLLSVPGPSFDLGSSAPSKELLERFLHEKRGFLLLLSRAYQQSRESYLRALDATAGQVRGEIKVRLGLALVDYLEAVDANTDTSAPTTATLEFGERAALTENRDLASIANRNAALMSLGAANLEPYEIL